MRNPSWILGGLVLLLAACGRTPAPATTAVTPVAAGDCHLRVGWDPWEPYQYEDVDGSMRGLDVEIVQTLAKNAGCSIEFQRGNWSDLLADVRAGKVDVLMAATSTPARAEFAAFSPSYRKEKFVVLTRAGVPAPEQDLAALVAAHKRIGVTEGYYYGAPTTALMEADDTQAFFVSAPVVELNYTRLLAGEIDAMLDDPLVAASVLRRKGLLNQVVRAGEIANGDVAFMYSRTSVPAPVRTRLDAALSAQIADGSVARLIDRYQGSLVASPALPAAPGSGGETVGVR